MKKITLILITSVMVISVLFLASLSLAGCRSADPKELTVYVWEGYLPESIVTAFEQETGIKLNITLIADNPTVITFLKGGGKADIIMPTQSQLNRFYEEDLVQPLDIKSISNYEKVSESLKDQPWTKWDGSQMGSGEIYAIPYVFGTSGLVINTSKYTKDLDNIGWDILFDTDLKGRVSSIDNAQSVWLICDLYDIPREDMISDTQGTLDRIRDKVVELKNNVLKFYETGAEITNLMENEEVWASYIWDGGGRNLSQLDSKFIYVLPETGGIAWTDTFAIPKEAENPSGANLFIDFMLRPEIAATLTVESGYKTTIKGALDLIEDIDEEFYVFTDEQMANLSWVPNMSEEVLSEYYTFWEEMSTIQ